MAAPSTSAAFAATFSTRMDQMMAYIRDEQGNPPLTLDALLDTMVALYTDCKTMSNTDARIKTFLTKYEKMLSRVNSWRVNTSDFETIKVLATGAVGTVCLVRAKADSKVYAMKTLKKIDLLTRQEAGFFMEERNALVFAQNSQWITTLHAAFQDEDNLYLIMEYVSGGSLRNFMNSQESALNEDDVKFYVAEMVLALDELHKNNIIHRDVKPENSLIDSSGHIKLADFGSCIKLSDSNAKICSGDTVGTPEYVCPEILQANEGKYSYSREADWWSLGIITYELLFDDTPFYSDSLMGLYHNIIGHEQNFVFPEEREVSPECRDFLSKLIVSGDKRLGRNSTAEIKAHPWFKGINWDTIRTQTPPFVPELNGPDDTRYFEDEEDESKKFAKKPISRSREYTGQNLPFVGFTYLKRLGQESAPASQRTRSISNASSIRPYGAMSGEENDTVSLRAVLTSEQNKYMAMQSTKNALEEKIASLESVMSQSQAKYAELKEQLLKSEQQRTRAETELRSVRDTASSSHDQTTSALNAELEKLRAKMDDESKLQAQLAQLQEQRLRLQGEIDTLRDDLQQERERAQTQSERLTVVTNEREALETHLRTSKSQATRQDESVQSLTAQVGQLEVRVAQQAKEIQDAEAERQAATKSRDALQETISALQDQITSQHDKMQQLGQNLADVESAKTFLERELETRSKRLREMTAEKQTLAQRLSELEADQNQSNAVADRAVALQAQLASAETRIEILTAEGQHVAQQRQQLDDDLTSLKKQLRSVQDGHSSDKIRLAASERRVTELQNHITDLNDNLARHEHASHEQEERLKTLKDQLAKAQSDRVDLEASIAALQQEKLNRQNEMAALSSAHVKETMHLQQQLQKALSDLAHAQEAEAAAQRTLTDLRATTEQSTRLTSNKIELLEAKVTQLVSEASTLIGDSSFLQSKLTVQSDDINDLNAKIEMLQRDRDRLTKQMKEYETLLEGEHEQHDFLEARRLEAVQSLADSQSDHRHAQSRIEELQSQIDEMYRTNTALQTECSLLKDRLASDPAHGTPTSVETPGSSPALSHPSLPPNGTTSFNRAKGRILKHVFKANREEQTKAMQKITEAEEELKARELHVRRLSIGSVHSMRSGVSRLTDQNMPEYTGTFSANEPICGWVKTPKGGKVKKGWKLNYAVLKDNQLMLFEREKDVGVLDGIVVADLRTPLFIVRAVSQNELIHANSKDIDCIFKIQSSRFDDPTMKSLPSNLGSHSALNSTRNLAMTKEEKERRMANLQKAVDQEEQMLKASEKMMAAAGSETARAMTLGHVEQTRKQLVNLRNALQQIQSVQPVSASASNEQLARSVSDWVKVLETELTELVKKRDAIKHEMAIGGPEETSSLTTSALAAIQPVMRKESALQRTQSQGHGGVNLDSQLSGCEKRISKVKDDIAVLKADDQERITALIAVLKEAEEGEEMNGHLFRPKHFDRRVTCQQCNLEVMGFKSASECSHCRVICHKNCTRLLDVDCTEVAGLKSTVPLYFMGTDVYDKLRWIRGLEFFRKLNQDEERA